MSDKKTLERIELVRRVLIIELEVVKQKMEITNALAALVHENKFNKDAERALGRLE